MLTQSRDTEAARAKIIRGPEAPAFPHVSCVSVEAVSDQQALIFLTLECVEGPDLKVPMTPPDAAKLSRTLQEAVRKYMGGPF